MKLIKITEDHFIIVDDSEVNIGDWYYDFSNKEICQSQFVKLPIEFGNCKKITHSTEPLNDIEYKRVKTLSLSKIKELHLEKVKEVSCEQYIDKSKYTSQDMYWFKQGYNQCLDDNKEKKYTLDDLKTAITQGFLSGTERLEDFERVEKMILENIQQQTEWEVYFDESGQLKLKQ